MIAKQIPHLDKVILVSPSDYSTFRIKQHLEDRALLVVVLEDPVLFDVGREWYVSLLINMHDTFGARANQCVLLYDPVSMRRSEWDTLLLWNNFGGVSLPTVYGLDATLTELEKSITNWENYPVEWETYHGV